MPDNPMPPRTDPATTAASGGPRVPPAPDAVAPPLEPSTTFERDEDYRLASGYLYRRSSHPNAVRVEGTLAVLEGGAEAMVFGAGMAGIVGWMETVPPGARVVAPQVMYHGTRDWLERLASRGRIRLRIFDPTTIEALAAAIGGDPVDTVWVEVPSNPMWDVLDVARAADVTHAAAGRLVVDATAATPIHLRPLELGADVVFHSATKYLNGHSDVTAGVLVTNVVDERWGELQVVRKLMGTILSPPDAWLLQRGLRTLAVRVRTQSASALAIARFLEGHPAVTGVFYPGLTSHPHHDVAVRQFRDGFGAMLSFRVADGAAAQAVATGTRLFTPATSLGGVESLIEHRAVVEGPHSTVPDDLLRLSVGIEATADLIADLEAALAKIS